MAELGGPEDRKGKAGDPETQIVLQARDDPA